MRVTLGVVAHRQLHARKELAQAVDGQQHQVVQAQAGQRFELLARPLHALGHEALAGLQRGIGIFIAANAPQQAFGLEPRARAGGAWRVAAVLGQEHADVHLVGLAFQVLKKTLDAVPLLVPLAVPVGRAVDDPLFVLVGQLVPGRVARDARGLGVAHEVVLRLFPRGGLNGLDGACAQRELVVGDDEAVVHPDHAAKAPAAVARAHGGVEREGRRNGVAVAQVAVGAVQAGGEAPQLGLALLHQPVDIQTPRAALERHLNGLDRARLLGIAQTEAVGHHIEHLARPGGRAHFALGLHLGKAAG